MSLFSYLLTSARWATTWNLVLPLLFLLSVSILGRRSIVSKRLFVLSYCTTATVCCLFWIAIFYDPFIIQADRQYVWNVWDLFAVHTLPYLSMLICYSVKVVAIDNYFSRQNMKMVLFCVVVYFSYVISAYRWIGKDQFYPYPFMDNLSVIDWMFLVCWTSAFNVGILYCLHRLN
jgi:hypothetical protein